MGIAESLAALLGAVALFFGANTADLTLQNETLKTEMAAKDAQIEELQKKLQERDTAKDKRIQQLETEVAELTRQKTEQANRIMELEQYKAALELYAQASSDSNREFAEANRAHAEAYKNLNEWADKAQTTLDAKDRRIADQDLLIARGLKSGQQVNALRVLVDSLEKVIGEKDADYKRINSSLTTANGLLEQTEKAWRAEQEAADTLAKNYQIASYLVVLLAALLAALVIVLLILYWLRPRGSRPAASPERPERNTGCP